MSYVKIDKNEILFCGKTNSEIGLYVRYKAICDHLQVKEMTWKQVCFNFDCKERKVISKMFGILPDEEPKKVESNSEVSQELVESKTDVSLELVESKSGVSLKKSSKNKEVVDNIYNNIYINNNTNQTRLDYTPPIPPQGGLLLPVETIPKEEQFFDEFWNIYTPVKSSDGRLVGKGSKEVAKKQFLKILKGGESYENIKRGLQKYIEFCRRNNQLTCGASVFLNQKRWLDDYECQTVSAEHSRGQRQEPTSIVETYAKIIDRCGNQEQVY